MKVHRRHIEIQVGTTDLEGEEEREKKLRSSSCGKTRQMERLTSCMTHIKQKCPMKEKVMQLYKFRFC
jgi:hypothetical protein